MELSAGSTLERYIVEAEIGRGGMAVVYRVRHATLGSLHALKLLSLTSRSLQDRLLQEGQVQANLRHPNVVSVTDVLDVEGQSGLLMEYVEGPSLEDWLHGYRPTFEQAEDLFRGIVSAVEVAHAKDLVHRDLKPANVLLAPLSGGFMPKVTDFGLAKALAESGSGPGTRSGVAMGTPKYMAPEQIRDAGGVDRRADLFSLGCILYELVAGQPPFDGPDVLSVFNRVATGAYDPLPADVPPHLAQAIHGCLVVDARARIPDCATLRAVLDGAAFEADYSPSSASISSSVGGTLLPQSFGGSSSETWSPELAAGSPRPSEPGSVPSTDRSEAVVASVPSMEPPGTSLPEPDRKPGRKARWLLSGAALVGLGGVAAAVLLGVGGAAAWMGLQSWHHGAVTSALEAHTGGEALVGAVELGLNHVTLRDVRVDGRDGASVLHAPRITVHGKSRWFLLGLDEIDDLKVHGLTVDLRQDADGWVLPDRTLAVLQGESAGNDAPPFDLEMFDTRLKARTERGVLTARVDLIDFNEISLDAAGWKADRLWVEGVHVDGAQPIGSFVSLEMLPGEARIRGVDAWVRSRRDGRLDLPPVLADGVPRYFGGELESGGRSWFEQVADALPVKVDAIRLESGQVHVVDTAHAVRDVTWTVDLDQASAQREGHDWRLIGQGRLGHGREGEGRALLDGGVDAEGRFQARVDLRDVPLADLSPYLDQDLGERGVKVDQGSVEGVFMLEETGAALGWQGMVALEDVRLKAVDRPPRGRAARLLFPRDEVDVEVSGLGVLSDPSYQPIEDIRVATVAALLAPAGRPSIKRRAYQPASQAVASGATEVDLLSDATPDANDEVIASIKVEDLEDLDEHEVPEVVPPSMAERWRKSAKTNREKFKAWLKNRGVD